MANIGYEDFSGASTPAVSGSSNPYDVLIGACHNDPATIQARYHAHRTARNAQQKEKILSSDFDGWKLDPILTKLEGPEGLRDPNFTDPRNCLVFWARPPQKVRSLIQLVQQKLKHVVPDLWLMPLLKLHMTALEATHSLTPPEVEALAERLQNDDRHKAIADLPAQPGKGARLIKPMLSFDAAALALSFVPAANEALPVPYHPRDDNYTYHHLRHDLWALITDAGVRVGSRYVVPSAHLTIARFNSPNPFATENEDSLDAHSGIDLEKRQRLIREIETINHWLEEEYWPQLQPLKRTTTDAVTDTTPGTDTDAQTQKQQNEDLIETIKPGGEWIVGEEQGLDFRKGTLWYGGGDTVYLGKGISRHDEVESRPRMKLSDVMGKYQGAA
ncbi:hypothetical protein LTR05_005383 [Lithohypha guttulata]|uniref:Uncharacterized protein n=1 Tax=Lithohypha guttulata TaxID=1690604 RepID=A0AAN7SY00_9EURO|nr:hypothetical protein LTR05_005383 [Lithohypha guttulata]